MPSVCKRKGSGLLKIRVHKKTCPKGYRRSKNIRWRRKIASIRRYNKRKSPKRSIIPKN